MAEIDKNFITHPNGQMSRCLFDLIDAGMEGGECPMPECPNFEFITQGGTRIGGTSDMLFSCFKNVLESRAEKS